MITLINHQGLKLIKGIQIQTPAPPLGLAYIGAFLKQNGYSYNAIDACGEALDQVLPYDKNEQIIMQGLTISQILERIPMDSKVIGFSCSYSHCWPLVKEIAFEVKKAFPDALYVAGGEHSSAMPENVLRNTPFDIVIRGEGEETFLDLIKMIEERRSWKEIEGIAFIEDDNKFVLNKARLRIKDIDSLPYPDWDCWCIKKYIEYQQVSGINLGKSMPILGSRGCPYACTFCSNERMWTRRYIMREGKEIVNEMEYMKNRYGIKGFSFYDSTFIINRSKTLEFCRELIKRNLNISYQLPAGTRCEVFDTELALALEKSGLKNFSFAPESGSEMIRKVVNKQIKLDNFIKAVKVVKKTKMTVGCFIVLGFPEDNKVTMKQTLSLVRKLALIGLDDVTVSKFTPYPGSIYFDKLLKKKAFSYQLTELNYIISFYSNEGRSYSESLSAKELYQWMIKMFINFYVISFMVRPWKVVKNFWNYFSKGVETTRYMRFFTDFFIHRRRWKKVCPP